MIEWQLLLGVAEQAEAQHGQGVCSGAQVGVGLLTAHVQRDEAPQLCHAHQLPGARRRIQRVSTFT